MNRVAEYIRFVMWFMGLGYAGLWPFTAYDVADLGVRLQMSPGLHLVGMMAASGVAICLLLRPLRRRWRRARATGADTPALQPVVRLRLLRKPPPPPPRRYVRPRTHFGLRNAPH
jgi:hypothetical protein